MNGGVEGYASLLLQISGGKTPISKVKSYSIDVADECSLLFVSQSAKFVLGQTQRKFDPAAKILAMK